MIPTRSLRHQRSSPLPQPGSLTSGWRSRAACRDDNGGDFYPPVHGERRAERRMREARAKAVCAVCTVRAECLATAIADDERYGVWGGLTDSERRALPRAG